MARISGRCLRTRADVRHGYVVKKPEVMAAVKVDTAGPKATRWRYWTMSDLVERVWLSFENGEC